MKPMLLVAEGDRELREVYRTFLAERSYHVETAADGLECLDKLRRLSPTVLVLDRELHWGGGDGVLAWLREEGPTDGVSVVLTATDDGRREVLGNARAPVVKVLPKPFALPTLLDSVRAAVAANRGEQRFDRNRPTVCPELYLG
jgi:DNA-binding response OmpR family regulator